MQINYPTAEMQQPAVRAHDMHYSLQDGMSPWKATEQAWNEARGELVSGPLLTSWAQRDPWPPEQRAGELQYSEGQYLFSSVVRFEIWQRHSSATGFYGCLVLSFRCGFGLSTLADLCHVEIWVVAASWSVPLRIIWPEPIWDSKKCVDGHIGWMERSMQSTLQF